MKRYFVVYTIASLLWASMPVFSQPECDINVDYLQQGIEFTNIGLYSQAIDALSCAIDGELDNALAYFYRGGSYLFNSEYENALADYSRILLLTNSDDDLYSDALFMRGITYAFLDEHENVIDDLSRFLELNTDDEIPINLYATRGHAYRQLENFERALADYTQAITLDEEDANLYSNRGFIYYEMGEIVNAIADWDVAFQLDENLTDSYRTSAVQLIRNARYEPALAQINEAILLDSYFGEFRWENHLTRAVPNLKLGNYFDAVLDANLALSSPESLEYEPQILLVRADAYSNLALYDLALVDVNHYIEIDPNNPQAYSIRGYIYSQQGDYQSSIDDYHTYQELVGEITDPLIQQRMNEVEADNP